RGTSGAPGGRLSARGNVFPVHVRRSGSKRSVWHRREPKRKRREVLAVPGRAPAAPPHPPPTAAPPAVFWGWVTERAWQRGNPGAMLGCLVRLATDRRVAFHLSHRQVERKLRLFYCACCRFRWDARPGDPVRRAVEVIERYARGAASRREL